VQALIDEALAAGRDAGFSRASLSFLIGNEPRSAAMGFTVAEERDPPSRR